MLITIDGITYEVDHAKQDMFGQENVVVWDTKENYIGSVRLDHNLEHAEAQLGGISNDVNYFDMSGKSTEEVGMWIAGVSE